MGLGIRLDVGLRELRAESGRLLLAGETQRVLLNHGYTLDHFFEDWQVGAVIQELALTALRMQPHRSVSVGDSKRLFFDDHAIEALDGVRKTLNQPTNHALSETSPPPHVRNVSPKNS